MKNNKIDSNKNQDIKAVKNDKKLSASSSVKMKTDKQISNNEKSRKPKNKKTIALMVVLISLIVLVVAGISIGMYFLFKTPDPVIPDEGSTPIEDFVSDINNNNNSSPDISGEDVALPSDVDLSKISYIDESYFIVSDNGVNTIYKRVSGNPGYEVISKFMNGANEIDYNTALKVYNDFAIIETNEEKAFLVNLQNESVVLETTNLNYFTFKDNFCFVYNGNYNDSGYYALKAVNLINGSVVLNYNETDKVYYVRISDELLYIDTDESQHVYFYEIVAGSLKLAYTEMYNNGFTLVPDDYVETEDDITIKYNGDKYLLSESNTVVYAMKNYKLVETRVPTKDYTKANYMKKMRIDAGNYQKIYYFVSYKIVDMNDNFVKNVESPGVFSLVYGRRQIDGYVMLDVEPFTQFNQAGEDANIYIKNDINAAIFDKNLNLLFSYNSLNLGDVIYSFGDYFVTTNGSDSGIIDKTGKVTGIINTEHYEIVSPNVWNNMFIVQSGSSLGVSDTDGNVILSPWFSELTPIVNGYTIGYYAGVYYLIDLNEKSLIAFSNYDVDFHKNTMLGIGMYMLDENGEKIIYAMNGEILYGEVKDYQVIFDDQNNNTFKMMVTLESGVELVKSEIIDQKFYNSYYDNYIASEKRDGYRTLESFNSLIFDKLKSFSVITQEDEESNQPQTVVSKDSSELIANPSADTMSVEEYIQYAFGKKTYGLDDYWWKAGSFLNHQGEIIESDYWGGFNNFGFNANIVLTPYICSGSGIDNVINKEEEYEMFWGEDGIGFGTAYINNNENYKPGQPLEMFGDKDALNAMIPSYDTLLNYYSVSYANLLVWNPSVDGVLIFASQNKHVVMVVTRIRLELLEGALSKISKDKLTTCGSFKYGNGAYNFVSYTYNVAIGFVDGYSVDELYIGNYIYNPIHTYSQPYDNQSSSVYQDANKYGPNGNGTLIPSAYYVPSQSSSAYSEIGLLVRDDNTRGWRETVNFEGESNLNNGESYTSNNKYNYPWYCRNFNEFCTMEGVSGQYFGTGEYPAADGYLSCMRYWGLGCINTYSEDNRFKSKNGNYFLDSTSLVRIALKFSTATEKTNCGVFADETEWSSTDDRTIYGTYYKIEIKDWNVTITPKDGFYISNLVVKKTVAFSWVNHKTYTVKVTLGKGSNPTVINIGKKSTIDGKTHDNISFHIESITVKPIEFNISDMAYTDYYDIAKELNIDYINGEPVVIGKKIIYYPYVGNYYKNTSELVIGEPISEGNNSLTVGSFYYGIKTVFVLNENFEEQEIPSYVATADDIKGMLGIDTDAYKFLASFKDSAYGVTPEINSFVDEEGKIKDYSENIYAFYRTCKDENSGLSYILFNSEKLNSELFKNFNSTTNTIYTYSLFKSKADDVPFTDDVYLASENKIINNIVINGMKIYNVENNMYEAFDLNEISTNILECSFEAYPMCTFGDMLNNFAKDIFENECDSNSNTYDGRFWDLLSKTTKLPILIGDNYKMNETSPTYRYAYGSGSYDVIKIDSMDDVIEYRAREENYPTIYGVYEERDFDVEFSNGGFENSNGDSVVLNPISRFKVFSYNSSGVEQKEYSFGIKSTGLGSGGKVTIPSVFTADYEPELHTYGIANPAVFNNIYKLKGFRDESGQLYTNISSFLINNSGYELSKLDANYDGVINIKLVFEAEPVKFKYTISFKDNDGNDIINSNYLTDISYSYTSGSGDPSDYVFINIQNETLSALAEPGGELVIKFKFKNPVYIVSDADICQHTCSTRPLRAHSYYRNSFGYFFIVGYKNTNNVFRLLNVNFKTTVNPFIDFSTTTVSGDKYRWDLDDFIYEDHDRDSTTVPTKKSWNDGSYEGLTEDEIYERFSLELNSDGYWYLTIKETEVGHFTTANGDFIGGEITINIDERNLQGDIEINTPTSSTINTFNYVNETINENECDVILNDQESKKKFIA